MLENLIYCLNATVPIFLLMALGVFLRKIGLLDQAAADKMSDFVFKVSLPVMLFRDLVESDFFAVWDLSFVLFCFVSSLLSILLMVLVSRLIRDRALGGEFIQVSYRSSIALLGAAFLENLYGSAGAASLVIVGAVPLYNVAAVAVLSLTSPRQGGLDRRAMKRALRGIVTNPILLGIAAGVLWTLLGAPYPTILAKTAGSLSATATPLGLMALGVSFDWKKALESWRMASAAAAFKLVIFVAIFLPAAVAMGFREDKLVAALAMLASPTTVSCFVMARGMGHEGTLTSSTVMLTTLFSAFTMTMWLYFFRTLGMV